MLPGVTVTATNAATNGCPQRPSPAPRAATSSPALPPGDIRRCAPRSPGFKPHVQRGLTLAVADTVVLNLDAASSAAARGTWTYVDGRLPLVNTPARSSATSSARTRSRRCRSTAATTPTWRCCSRACSPIPHRDGGSVVAHGLGMSVNGQDPRSNVYLLDGTLLNDFTNGPAGSAAGRRSAWRPSRSSASRPTPTAPSSAATAGGQINVLTKSGANALRGSAYEFHRNDALDAQNYFDVAGKPDFTRNQFGGTVGGPLVQDRLFFFVGYEALRRDARQDDLDASCPTTTRGCGILPDRRPVGVNAGGRALSGAIPARQRPGARSGARDSTRSSSTSGSIENFVQGRLDYSVGAGQPVLRPLHVRRCEAVPADRLSAVPARVHLAQPVLHRRVPQVLSARDAQHRALRLQPHADRPGSRGQHLAAAAAVRARAALMGDIDIGGMQRFGPQSSVDLRLVQNVFSGQDDLVARARPAPAQGRRAGRALPGQHGQPDVQPRHLRVRQPAARSSRTAPTSFVGLTPEAQFDRYWPFTLFGATRRTTTSVTPTLTRERRAALRVHDDAEDIYGRDSSLLEPDGVAADRRAAVSRTRPTRTSRRASGVAWDVFGDGTTSVRGGYGLYFNTNNQQNLIVTVTNPPATPRVVIANPTFPTPPFDRGVGQSRSGRCSGISTPRACTCGTSACSASCWWRTALTVGYAGSRGRHLLRSTDVNTAAPDRQRRRHGVLRRRHAAPEHELLDHRAEEQRRRVLVQRAHRRRPAALAERRVACSRRTRCRRAKTRRRRRRSSPTRPTARRRRFPSSSPATTRGRRTSTRGTTG